VILVANLASDDFYEPDEPYQHPPGPPPNVVYEPVSSIGTSEP